MFPIQIFAPFVSSIALFVFHLSPVAPTNKPACNSPKQATILAQAKGLHKNALQYAVDGYNWAKAKGDVKNPNILTVIDFSLPSNKKRLWVINLKDDTVLLNTYAAHGKNSGLTHADHFSNQLNSHETSLGVYETLSTYSGHHGQSLRLQGLEKGINNNAYKREIVVHSAPYMTKSFINKEHRTGRSWGCFALSPAVSHQFMDLTKGGSIIFAYASPEESDHNIA